MAQTRKDIWLIMSYVCDEFAPFLRDIVQGLGVVDHRLLVDDERFNVLSDNDKCVDEESMEFHYRRTISYLWVLGAYEVLRTMDQRAKQCPSISDDGKVAIKNLKDKFARLRMPLAKLEAKKSSKSDWNVAWPSSGCDGPVSWQISAATQISRIELSEEFLGLFKVLYGELKEKMPFSL